LKELGRSYLAISKDLTRAMNRVKALYRSWSIPCGGASVYAQGHRKEWLSKITEPGVRRRAELFYQQLDGLQKLRQEARRDLLAESRKHGATELLRRIPYIGPIRAALLIALMQTPHRFLKLKSARPAKAAWPKGMPIKEAARLLRCAEGTVNSNVSRARDDLRRELAEVDLLKASRAPVRKWHEFLGSPSASADR
jgi:hypothetical protein